MKERYPIAFGKYRLLRKIAQGGMAEIFLAQERGGRILAIKRILPHLAQEESFIRMFIDEARIVSRLKHPNVAQVYEQDKQSGFYYIAMEFVEGPSLLRVTEKAKSMKVALPRGLFSYVMAEVLAALSCAHQARDERGRSLGVVHRDVTPQNILISYSGEVKLIDFGVAKARARLTHTETGFTKGKLAYMSPEQARGEKIDGRSDLFSAGIILYEITTGARLYQKEGPGGILNAIVNDEVTRPSKKSRGYPKDLELAVLKSLEKSTRKRFQTADDMRDALLAAAGREKPPPSASRLAAFIHDLFGDSENRSVIEAAEGALAPTPPEVRAHQLLSTGDNDEAKEPTGQTRMVPPEKRAPSLGPEDQLLEETLDKVQATEASETSQPGKENDPSEATGSTPEIKSEVVSAEPSASSKLRWKLLAVLLVSAALFLVPWGGMLRGMKSMFTEDAPKDPGPAGPPPSVLRLTSRPPGAVITLNGFGLGEVTPHDLKGLATDRPITIELKLAGYHSRRETIRMKAGQGLREIEFVLDRRIGSLRIDSEPVGAEVRIDGKSVEGRTPLVVDGLPAGESVKIRVSKRGYLTQRVAAVVEDKKVVPLMVQLVAHVKEALPGSLTIVSAPPGCPVFVNQKPVGHTPLRRYSVRPGSYGVRVKCEHHEEKLRQVKVPPKKEIQLAFSLKPSVFGYLTIRSIPADAVISVNGKIQQSDVEFLKVIPGHHAVKVAHPGLRKSKEIVVRVGPDDRVVRTVNLLRTGAR